MDVYTGPSSVLEPSCCQFWQHDIHNAKFANYANYVCQLCMPSLAA
jgi:hypothetical protein